MRKVHSTTRFPPKRYYTKKPIQKKKSKRERISFEDIKNIGFYDESAAIGIIYKIENREHRYNLLVKWIYFKYCFTDKHRTPPPFNISEGRLICSLIGIQFFIKTIYKYVNENTVGKINILLNVYSQIIKHKIPNNIWGKNLYQIKPKILRSIKKTVKHFSQVLKARKGGKILDYDEYLRTYLRKHKINKFLIGSIKKGDRYKG